MRSDPADRAGGSAADGYVEARIARSRRRRLQVVALVAAALVAALASGTVWRAVAAGLGLLVAWWLRPDRDPARWLRGAAGEEATAALLATLPTRRFVVLHDRAVPGSRANLDHVVIGRTGVWLVDSKAFRSPLRPGWRSVQAGDHAVTTDAASWEASVVAERLGVEVRPLLAVHGTGLPPRGRRVNGVPVLPAASVPRRLCRRRGSARLRRAEVSALAAACDLAFPPAIDRAATDRPATDRPATDRRSRLRPPDRSLGRPAPLRGRR